MANEFSLKSLLEAGAHFGHQTHKWNPKMKKYIYGEKNGIYIIDLAKTMTLAKEAAAFLKKTASEGKPVLFVGTKRQATEIIKDEAIRSRSYYVTHRWLGGMLTNYKTVSLSVDKLKKVEKMKETGDFNLLTKKEKSKIEKDVIKLERNLGGIKDMKKVPGALFIIDPSCEKIAILEANKLGIPVVALADTNCDPTGIDYVVPGNDDALKSISLFVKYFSDAIAEGAANARRTDKEEGSRDIALEDEIINKFEHDIDLLGAEEETEE